MHLVILPLMYSKFIKGEHINMDETTVAVEKVTYEWKYCFYHNLIPFCDIKKKYLGKV